MATFVLLYGKTVNFVCPDLPLTSQNLPLTLFGFTSDFLFSIMVIQERVLHGTRSQYENFRPENIY